MTGSKIAILLPCYNEAADIAKVVSDFKKAIPQATIYVGDNNSKDETAFEAKKAGAFVIHEYRQGKGHVVRRLFADVDANIYIMADGDDTYDAKIAQLMVNKLIQENLDMVVATRSQNQKAYRLGHQIGNRLFNWLLTLTFNSRFKEVFPSLDDRL
jgi:glycosyltransferase involved in cell wall biosynthesis